EGGVPHAGADAHPGARSGLTAGHPQHRRSRLRAAFARLEAGFGPFWGLKDLPEAVRDLAEVADRVREVVGDVAKVSRRPTGGHPTPSAGSPIDLWKVSGDVREVAGRPPRHPRKTSGRSPDDVAKVFGGCVGGRQSGAAAGRRSHSSRYDARMASLLAQIRESLVAFTRLQTRPAV